MHNAHRHLTIGIWLLFTMLLWLTIATPLFAQNRQMFIPIYQIQGKGLVSPYVKAWIDTYGIVTGVLQDGFYLQDPQGDNDLATSDGIFVYTQKTPTVQSGQCVEVTRAYVDEFYEKTELSRLKSVLASIRCAPNRVTTTQIPLARLGITPTIRFEAYEGMLVTTHPMTGTVQGPTKHFATGEIEVAILATDLAVYLPTGRVFQADTAAMHALTYLTNELGATLPDAAWGDTLQVGATAAILDYNFGKYQLHLLPGTPITHTAHARLPEQGSASMPDSFTLCTFNLHGLGRGSAQYPDERLYAQQLAKRAQAIAETIQGCTMIGLQETGTPDDAEKLAAFLRTYYQLDYVATALAGPGTQSQEFPLTNSLLTRRDQVQVRQALLPQGCSSQDYAVPVVVGDCPAGGYALFDRPPLVVDLTITGEWPEPLSLTVIVNHWKSKGGDEKINVVRRKEQARHVATLVQAKLRADPAGHIAVLGDLNDYYQSEPIDILRTTTYPTTSRPALIHLYDYLPTLDRYTYIFNGGSQVLDHILVTPALAQMVARVDPIHANADFPSSDESQLVNVQRSSDHDPVQIQVRPEGAAVLGGSLHYPNIQVQLLDENRTVVGTTTTDAMGDFRLWNLATGIYTVTFMTPAAITLEPSAVRLELEGGYQQLLPLAVTHRNIKLGAALALTAAAFTPESYRNEGR
jgi:uncharacterized protein